MSEPAGTAASVVHRGSYDQLGRTHGELLAR